MINFENLPSRKTPINNVNLNKLQKDILETLNPIGTIRMQTTNTNPRTYLGFGTWVLWGQGRVPVGIDTAQTEFNSVEKTGGEKTHKLTVSEMPSHSHTSFGRIDRRQGSGEIFRELTEPAGSDGNNVQTGETGENSPHNNLQPYITCYMWKRTA